MANHDVLLSRFTVDNITIYFKFVNRGATVPQPNICPIGVEGESGTQEVFRAEMFQRS
jgi:hypothetical protein